MNERQYLVSSCLPMRNESASLFVNRMTMRCLKMTTTDNENNKRNEMQEMWQPK